MSWDAASPFAGLTEAQRDQVAVALGVREPPPDPAELSRELRQASAAVAERDARVRQMKVEFAVLREAGRHGGDPEALLDSRTFMTRAAKLDPDAADFGDQLASVIRDTAGSSQDRSEHKAALRGGQQQWTMAQVEAARTQDPALIVRAQEAGLLRDLGYPPPGDSLAAVRDPRYDDDPRVRRARRRAELTRDYGGPDGSGITRQDLADADPRVVSRWTAAGKLAHFGVPGQKGAR